MSTTYSGPILTDPPAADLRRLLSLRRAVPLAAEVSAAQLAQLWGCSQLLATARLARLNRLRLADVRQASPSTFYVLPITSHDPSA